MSAPEGEELYFFIELGSESAMDLTIETWGGEGDLELIAELEEFCRTVLLPPRAHKQYRSNHRLPVTQSQS